MTATPAPTDLDPGLGLPLTVLAVVGAAFFTTLLLAPRLLWPDRVRPEMPPAPQRPDWGWLPVLLVPPLIVGFQLVGYPIRWAGVPPSLWLSFALSIGSAAATVALAWWLLCRRPGKPVAALGLRLPRWRPHLVLLPLAAYPLSISLIILAVLFQVLALGQPLAPPQASVQAMRAIQDPALKALAVLAVAVVAPIAEEILFRGVLFRALRLRWGVFPAMLVSAAIFSAVHLDLLHALPIFMLGLVLAFITEESGSLIPGITLHALVNGITLWVTWSFPVPG
ncbi:MAG: CPBP family intramembrane metalloprotease [Candidatus Brocadiae bacterium]|nr:CPBP family intramembrane metalloprotease [Candidatus Brocadiia bacterium]